MGRSLTGLALLVASGLAARAQPAPVALRIAGAQIAVRRDVAANVAAIERAIEYAAAQKADILLTPEGALSGYWPQFDAARTAAALERVTATARRARLGLALGTCFEEPEDGRRYDQLRFYTPEGTYLGFHAKILLCRRVADPASKGEIDYFSTRPLRTFSFKGIPVAGLICNDLWANPEWTPQDDPHLSQQLAARGVRVLFQAVNSGQAEGDELALNRHYHESNLRIRARAGKLWIVVADAADPGGRLPSQCPSGVIDPSGNWALRIDTPGERLFTYDIRMAE